MDAAIRAAEGGMSMACDYYRVLYRDIVIAERMTLETACILVKALFEHFWEEPSCQYTIEKMAEEGE